MNFEEMKARLAAMLVKIEGLPMEISGAAVAEVATLLHSSHTELTQFAESIEGRVRQLEDGVKGEFDKALEDVKGAIVDRLAKVETALGELVNFKSSIDGFMQDGDKFFTGLEQRIEDLVNGKTGEAIAILQAGGTLPAVVPGVDKASVAARDNDAHAAAVAAEGRGDPVPPVPQLTVQEALDQAAGTDKTVVVAGDGTASVKE